MTDRHPNDLSDPVATTTVEPAVAKGESGQGVRWMQEQSLSGTTYSITDLAREFGVTPRAIRYYEDKGLLRPFREGNKRIYRRRDRTRLKLILRAKRLGVSLDEARELFDLYDEMHGEARQLRKFLNILAERRAILEQQRRDIDETLAEIDHIEGECRRRLEQELAAGE